MILLEVLVCPVCRGSLARVGAALTCSQCKRRFSDEDGVARLVDALGEHQNAQADYFDKEVDREFEIERPHDSPPLYAWLLQRKFRYATESVPLRGKSVLVVCGGSGMDAEFLTDAGAEVISSDISLGAARRAQERARRHGKELSVVVADAERLPFADRSFDVAYVHDGLHHIERPLAGLAEMARVAGSALCVTEPARAGVTAAAARVGLAQNVEDAGNRVERLSLDEVTDVLRESGFRILHKRRYAMYYRHEPGRVMKALSRPGLFAVSRVALELVATAAGPIGNKLAVVGVRR